MRGIQKEKNVFESSKEFKNEKFFDKFLIATPKVIDLDFCCSVIYILNDGTNGKNPFGVILNGRKVSEVVLLKQKNKSSNIDSFLSSLEDVIKIPEGMKSNPLMEEVHPVYFSGPIDTGINFFYNEKVFTPKKNFSVATNISSGSYKDFINFAAKDYLKEDNFRVSTGTVRWKNELQLNFEIENGAWKVVDFNKDLFFNTKELNKMSGKVETRLSPSLN